jgi:hypothetical protein
MYRYKRPTDKEFGGASNMEKVSVKIGYVPTRREVFSKQEAQHFRKII